MKVLLEDLTSPKTIQINGDEPWLEDLYKSFLKEKGKKSAPLLTGTVTVKSEGYGYVALEGEISYIPFVPCSRCADPISWSLSRQVKARFKPQDDFAGASEVDLIAEDLDFYYVEDDRIDLKQVIVDTVMTSLPSQLVKKSEDGKSCTICHKDISSEEVYRSKSKEEESPFAALKNLKLPN